MQNLMAFLRNAVALEHTWASLLVDSIADEQTLTPILNMATDSRRFERKCTRAIVDIWQAIKIYADGRCDADIMRYAAAALWLLRDPELAEQEKTRFWHFYDAQMSAEEPIHDDNIATQKTQERIKFNKEAYDKHAGMVMAYMEDLVEKKERKRMRAESEEMQHKNKRAR